MEHTYIESGNKRSRREQQMLKCIFSMQWKWTYFMILVSSTNCVPASCLEYIIVPCLFGLLLLLPILNSDDSVN